MKVTYTTNITTYYKSGMAHTTPISNTSKRGINADIAKYLSSDAAEVILVEPIVKITRKVESRKGKMVLRTKHITNPYISTLSDLKRHYSVI